MYRAFFGCIIWGLLSVGQHKQYRFLIVASDETCKSAILFLCNYGHSEKSWRFPSDQPFSVNLVLHLVITFHPCSDCVRRTTIMMLPLMNIILLCQLTFKVKNELSKHSRNVITLLNMIWSRKQFPSETENLDLCYSRRKSSAVIFFDQSQWKSRDIFAVVLWWYKYNWYGRYMLNTSLSYQNEKCNKKI